MAVHQQDTGQQIATLAAAAGRAATAAQWQQAESLWLQVIGLAPAHPQALYSLGVHAYQRGDLDAAQARLEQAAAASPGDPMIAVTIGRVRQARGDLDGEWDAIGRALALDPYFLPGLLARAEFLAARGRRHQAAAVYRNALGSAPPEPQWPAVLRTRLQRAADAVAQDGEEMFAHLQASLADAAVPLAPALRARWDETMSITAGRSKPYPAEGKHLRIPRLPAQPFYDEALFPWIPELQRRTPAILAEVRALIEAHDAGFVPYVAYAADQPVNQWQALNHSRDWSSWHLWAHGAPVADHLARCPATAEALALVDAACIDGVCPNAMFSVLSPKTVIPPHQGETNARLVAHLPLIVPEGCRFRVGYDWRQWEPGKVFVFDDSIEHEARNDSDEIRVVLLFDVWNPLLTPEERGMVNAMEQALAAWQAR